MPRTFATRSADPVPTRPARGATRAALRAAALMAFATLALVGCSRHDAPPDALTTDAAHRPVMFGAYSYGGVWSGMEPILELEEDLGRDLAVVHWFMPFDHPYAPELVDGVLAGGRTPMISLEPVGTDLGDIAAGRHDDHLRDWARGVRDAAGPVHLRPFPEMNGDWTPWNGDPDTLVAAWRRMATLFAREGAHNVRWVFSPNVTDEPRIDANRMERYYPGDDVVDVLALDGYNWGTTRDGSAWTPFERVFRDGYDRIARLGPQPVWFAEVASARTGGNKAAWVADMFREAPSAFPRLEAIVWFDERKEADWRIDSDPDVLHAFREALATRDGSTSSALDLP